MALTIDQRILDFEGGLKDIKNYGRLRDYYQII